MAEVAYFVALPFIATDDGVAAGEQTESGRGRDARGSVVAQGRPRRRGRIQPHW